jgi:hypothetical protein
MPISTDVNWPQSILNIFNINRKPNPPLLALQTAHDKTSPHDAVDLASMVVFNLEYKPVLIMEIRDDGWANEPDNRRRADSLMRQRFDQMLPDCDIPRLYGLSLLGTSLHVYCGDKVTGVVTPQFVGRLDVNQVLPPGFLEGQ